jgi:hypothetical protein
MWLATAHTGGNAYATSVTLVESMADETVLRLFQDHLIDWCIRGADADSLRQRVRAYDDSVVVLKSQRARMSPNNYLGRWHVDSLIRGVNSRKKPLDEALRRCN